MRTTVTIDDELYRKTLEMADPSMDKVDIWRKAFQRSYEYRQPGGWQNLAAPRPKWKTFPVAGAILQRSRHERSC